MIQAVPNVREKNKMRHFYFYFSLFRPCVLARTATINVPKMADEVIAVTAYVIFGGCAALAGSQRPFKRSWFILA